MTGIELKTPKKKFERLKKVRQLIALGVKEYDIAKELNVSLSTIERDVRELYRPEDPTLAQIKLNEEIAWDLRQATQNYLKANTHEEKLDWLRLRGRILFMKAVSLKNSLTIQFNQQTNNTIELKPDIDVVLAALKADKAKTITIKPETSEKSEG